MKAGHQHEELELNIVLRGNAAYTVDGVRYDLRSSSVIWLFPDQKHMLIQESSDFEMWVVVFSPALLKKVCTSPANEHLLQSKPSDLFCKQFPTKLTQTMNVFIGEMETFLNDFARYNAALGYLLLWAWAEFQNAQEITSDRDVHPAVIRAAKILDRETELMGIDELAKLAKSSPSHLSRIFRQQIGLTITQYRQKLRLRRFVEIYGQGRRKNIIEAALEAGFGSYPQFHRVFKTHFGLNPAQYRHHTQRH